MVAAPGAVAGAAVGAGAKSGVVAAPGPGRVAVAVWGGVGGGGCAEECSMRVEILS